MARWQVFRSGMFDVGTICCFMKHQNENSLKSWLKLLVWASFWIGIAFAYMLVKTNKIQEDNMNNLTLNRPATLADWLFNDGYYDFSPSNAFSPRSDLYSDDKSYHLELELPGLEKKDVKVEVKDGVLNIEGTYKEREGKFFWFKKERPIGKVSTSYRLGKEINAESIEAKMEHGVLRVTFAKTPQAVPKLIEVK